LVALALALSALNTAALVFLLTKHFFPAVYPAEFEAAERRDWEHAEFAQDAANDIIIATPCGLHHPSPSDRKAAAKVRAELRKYATMNPYA